MTYGIQCRTTILGLAGTWTSDEREYPVAPTSNDELESRSACGSK